MAALLSRRHDAYLQDQRAHSFEPVFRRFDRQAVLVDVLGALHAGCESFDDTAESLAAIAESLRYGGSWLDWITGAGVSHVAFAATKADHVPEASRENLAALLGVRAPHLPPERRQLLATMAISAARSAMPHVLGAPAEKSGEVLGELKRMLVGYLGPDVGFDAVAEPD